MLNNPQLVPLFFWSDLFLEARAEILKKFRWYFGPNDDTTHCLDLDLNGFLNLEIVANSNSCRNI